MQAGYGKTDSVDTRRAPAKSVSKTPNPLETIAAPKKKGKKQSSSSSYQSSAPPQDVHDDKDYGTEFDEDKSLEFL